MVSGKPDLRADCTEQHVVVAVLFRSRCTRNKRGQDTCLGGSIEDAVDRLRARLESSEGKEKVRLRRDVGGASVWNDEASFQSRLSALEGTSEG